MACLYSGVSLSYPEIGGLVIRKIKAIPVFVRISRPMIFFLLKKVLWSWSIGLYAIIWRVSLSRQIMVNPDRFSGYRDPWGSRYPDPVNETPLYAYAWTNVGLPAYVSGHARICPHGFLGHNSLHTVYQLLKIEISEKAD